MSDMPSLLVNNEEDMLDDCEEKKDDFGTRVYISRCRNTGHRWQVSHSSEWNGTKKEEPWQASISIYQDNEIIDSSDMQKV